MLFLNAAFRIFQVRGAGAELSRKQVHLFTRTYLL